MAELLIADAALPEIQQRLFPTPLYGIRCVDEEFDKSGGCWLSFITDRHPSGLWQGRDGAAEYLSHADAAWDLALICDRVKANPTDKTDLDSLKIDPLPVGFREVVRKVRTRLRWMKSDDLARAFTGDTTIDRYADGRIKNFEGGLWLFAQQVAAGLKPWPKGDYDS